jgi:hypothetical protein
MIQKRKKAQFNFIDALIVIFIVGLIGIVVYGLAGGFRTTEQTERTDVTFDVRISNVKETALALITEGITVRDSVTGEVIGTVASVRTEKSRYYGGVHEDESGGYTLNVTEYPDEYDVYVTVVASGESDSRGVCSVGNIRILIGETVHFQVKSFSAVSHIVSKEIPE